MNKKAKGVLHHVSDDVFYMAPVPVLYHQVSPEGLDSWHAGNARP